MAVIPFEHDEKEVEYWINANLVGTKTAKSDLVKLQK